MLRERIERDSDKYSAVAVISLVMGSRTDGKVGAFLDGRQDLRSLGGVILDDRVFFVGELAGLIEDGERNAGACSGLE